MSYVVRPSRSASDACTSALICSPDSASQNGRSQPAYSKSPSCSVGPPLAWITPSSVMFMLTCNSPIAPPPHHSRCVHSDHLDSQDRYMATDRLGLSRTTTTQRRPVHLTAPVARCCSPEIIEPARNAVRRP